MPLLPSSRHSTVSLLIPQYLAPSVWPNPLYLNFKSPLLFAFHRIMHICYLQMNRGCAAAVWVLAPQAQLNVFNIDSVTADLRVALSCETAMLLEDVEYLQVIGTV